MVMKRILWILLIVLASGYVFGQEQAVLREFSGKVEVMPPGKNWEPAARNLVLPTGTIISTGFNSYATVQVGSANLQDKTVNSHGYFRTGAGSGVAENHVES
jgi:hypothetical protein